MRFKIEKGIPIPGKKETSKWKALLLKMKPGDSVLLKKSLATTLFTSAKRYGVKVTTRKVTKMKVRVWRVK